MFPKFAVTGACARLGPAGEASELTRPLDGPTVVARTKEDGFKYDGSFGDDAIVPPEERRRSIYLMSGPVGQRKL